MAIYFSIIAIIISVTSLLIPIIDKDFRRGYLFSKRIKRVKHYEDHYRKYSYRSIPLSWIGTAYHLKPDLMNYASHTLDMYFLEQQEVKEAVFYLSLKDFQSISKNTFKLLVEDPFGEIWTGYVETTREFIEDNLDKIIKIEAEIISRESEEGIALFQPESKNKFVIHPIKIEATNIPTLIYEMD